MDVSSVPENGQHAFFPGEPRGYPHLDIREVRLDQHEAILGNEATAYFGIARHGQEAGLLA